MAAFIDTGTTITSIAYDDYTDALWYYIREPIQRFIHEILYPRNWRWFHTFAERPDPIAPVMPALVAARARRVQERYPVSEGRARKRRAWLVRIRA